jgi:hypothetical protein
MAFHSIFVRTTGQLTQKWDDPIENGTSGHPRLTKNTQFRIINRNTELTGHTMPSHGAIVLMWQESLCVSMNLRAVSTGAPDSGRVTLVDIVEMETLV